MTLQPTLDEELQIEDGKGRYKLLSVYQKDGLLVIKFETKFKMHRGTFKLKRAMKNPATGRAYFYEDIKKAVKKIYDINNTKKYVSSVSNDIDKIFEVELE